MRKSTTKQLFRIHQCKVDEVSDMLRESGERNINERIPYFTADCFDAYRHTYHFFLALVGKKIVGAAMLAPSTSHAEGWKCIRFIGVDPDYQGQGIGRQLNEEIFKYCSENGFSVFASSYSEMGIERLKKMNFELAEKHNVEFEDSDMQQERFFEITYKRKPTDEEKKRIHIRF